MGLSLGSVVASTFAFKHPEMSERLIMTGTLAKPRKSWRMLLEESMRVLDAEQMSEFGEAVVLYLINHARLKETQIPEVACRLFRRQMRTFSENEKQRYRINAHRLIGVEEVLGYPLAQPLLPQVIMIALPCLTKMPILRLIAPMLSLP
jgi:pimeloyl-ACP methyl ester carboxylesterase